MDAGDDAGASNGELEETDYQGYSTPSGSDTSDTTTTYGAWPINDSGHQYNDLKHLWEHHVPRQLPPDAFSPGLRGGPQWVGGTWRLAAWEDLTLPEQASTRGDARASTTGTGPGPNICATKTTCLRTWTPHL